MITECIRCLYLPKCCKFKERDEEMTKCEDFTDYKDFVKVQHGVWEYYSTTMMECSICKRHTARHRYQYCPHCGSMMSGKNTVQIKDLDLEGAEQLSIFDMNTGKLEAMPDGI